MPKRTIDLRGRGRPLLDVVSYARGGLGRRDRLSPAQIEHISYTVNRTPEVLIKVLSQGGQGLGAARAHLEYIRKGEDRMLETDQGDQVTNKDATRHLLEDWDLDVEASRRRSDLTATGRRKPPKLVHKLVFSMPAGTPPEKLLRAVRNFAREEFALKHRYALALHTDEPHPHVHIVVKAMSEQGERLNIRNATLQEWRREFARHLRSQGVAANATERAVRGVSRTNKLDGIYRPMVDERRRSTQLQAKVTEVAADLATGRLRAESGKTRLMDTRREVEQGWKAVSEILVRQGQAELARAVDRFVEQMPPPRTEREEIALNLVSRLPATRNAERQRSR